MDILFNGNILIEDVVITSAAEHEEELMKSDFISLSWSDAAFYVLPVGAYIIPYNDGVKYMLLEPYIPEQKSEAEWKYEPKFHHEKMYASKVTYELPTSDSESNPISLIDWDFSGGVGTLLDNIVDALNAAYNLSGQDVFKWEPVGTFNEIIDVRFSANDILSALNAVANACSCEWHIDWANKMLWFGHIRLDGSTLPVLTVGSNVKVPSTRDSKEGYYNAYLPQGSTRNITRRAVTGEAVQSTVRLSLDRTEYPDGIIYTDGEGHTMTKAQFEAAGLKKFVKALIFEEIYPKQDAYIYNIRYRERYMLDGEGNRVVASENPETGEKTYMKYADWYFRIGIKDANDNWTDYRIGKRGYADVEKLYKARAAGETQDILLVLDVPYKENYFVYGNKQVTIRFDERDAITGEVYMTTYLPMFDFKGRYTNQSGETIFIGDNTFALYINRNAARAGEVDMGILPFEDAFDEVYTNIYSDDTIEFAGGLRIAYLPDEKQIGNIIDGKKPIIAFQPNRATGAYGTPLAGQGSGDGEGHYGFEIGFCDGSITEDSDYCIGQKSIAEINANPTEEGDTGVRDAIDDTRTTIGDGDFYIVFEQNGNFVKPTTKAGGNIPRGAKTQSVLNNLVNIYNVALDSSFEVAAKTVLKQEALNYIADSLVDNNSYTVNSDPVSFEANNPNLFIGEKIILVANGTQLETRVMKLVTKLDYAFEQEITVGNEILKGPQSQLREQVQAIISGGAGGSGGGSGSGGCSPQMVKNLIKEYTDPRFLSKIADDTSTGNIRAEGGVNVGNGSMGMKPNGDAKAKDVKAETIDAEEATIDEVKSHNFEHGIDTGMGWKIDANGNAEFESGIFRSFLEVIELLVNRIQAQEGDTVFSDNDQIEHVTRRVGANNEVTYLLDLKEKWDGYVTPQMYNNILKGIINTLAAKEAGVSDYTSDTTGQSRDSGGNLYYTSWMRVVNTHNTDNSLGLNQIEVVLYGDNDVPAGRNFEPCPMMVIARRGCVDYSDPSDPDYETVKQSIIRRQRFFEISASDGRVTKFTGVDHPMLANGNYGVTIGELPEFVKAYADVARVLQQVGEHTDWLYAQGIVVQNLIQIDKEGLPQNHYVDCGAWVDGSQIAEPTPRHGEYLYYEFNENAGQFETHDVWHLNCKWRCLQHQPVVSGGVTHYYEPKWNSAYWKMIEGNPNFSIEFESSKGFSFRRGFVDTYITPILYYGNTVIPDDDVPAENFTWTRESESGKTDADRAWDAQHQYVKTIHLGNNDMPATWSTSDKAIFTCIIVVDDGQETRTIENQIIS